MMEFEVKNVSVQDRLTVVALEPLKRPLFLGDAIPPGCIQHIIASMKKNIESKEECERLCGVLMDVFMDDDTSRKQTYSFPFHNPLNSACETNEVGKRVLHLISFSSYLQQNNSNTIILNQLFLSFLI